MNLYKMLYQFAKSLQAEHRYENLPEMLLHRIVTVVGANKGFIVVREGNDYQEKFHIHFDRSALSEEKRRFSRSLVREAIAKRTAIFSRDIAEDRRFHAIHSIQSFGRVSVLVVPLQYEGEVYAVIYLEKPEEKGAFSDEEREFLHEFADIAGLSLHLALERESYHALKRSHDQGLFARFNFQEIVGHHPRMLQLLELVGQVADADAGVLIHGETGTGKELVARALYLNSSRRNKPFVTLHCGALPETLFESELFGHTRGAFTGAIADRAGRIAQARDGTLFIDEVGEIPQAAQAKLLRFFQNGEFQRLGSDRVEKANCRILAATHRDLPAMIREGTFREDLYYRLKVVELKVPPLRERKSDIVLLLETFLAELWRRPGKPAFTAPALACLKAYDYPGNVRELRHIVERACLLAKGPSLGESLLPEEVQAVTGERASAAFDLFDPGVAFTNEVLKTARRNATEAAVTQVERVFLDGLMREHSGNIAAAANAAGMQKTYLYKLLAKHGRR